MEFIAHVCLASWQKAPCHLALLSCENERSSQATRKYEPCLIRFRVIRGIHSCAIYSSNAGKISIRVNVFMVQADDKRGAD